jgi:hypothetical protein
MDLRKRLIRWLAGRDAFIMNVEMVDGRIRPRMIGDDLTIVGCRFRYQRPIAVLLAQGATDDRAALHIDSIGRTFLADIFFHSEMCRESAEERFLQLCADLAKFRLRFPLPRAHGREG